MEIKADGRPRVVVCEDNESMRRFICNLLRQQFDVVAAVSNGQSAIDIVARLHPDVLVTEVLLPVLDGIQVVRHLQALQSDCRVVILTGLESGEFIDAAMAAGAHGFVVKRHATTDLMKAIGEVVAGRSFVSTDPPRS